jgi:glutaredoxin
MKALLWSKNNCPYCVQAKKILEINNADIEIRLIDGVKWTKEHLLSSVPEARSVPQIFINDEYVGGYQDLVKYIAESKH